MIVFNDFFYMIYLFSTIELFDFMMNKYSSVKVKRLSKFEDEIFIRSQVRNIPPLILILRIFYAFWKFKKTYLT